MEHDHDMGFQYITSDDLDEFGTNFIIDKIRRRVGSRPVYLRYAMLDTYLFAIQFDLWQSLDIDVIDPGFAPASTLSEF